MKFYLTFGQGHPLRNGWVEVEANSFYEAHEKAFKFFGKFWSMLYLEKEFEKHQNYFPDGKVGRTLK